MGCFGSSLPKSGKTVESLNQLVLSSSLFVVSSTREFKDVYQLSRALGVGTFGEVRLCTHLVSGSTRAVKLFYRMGETSASTTSKMVHELEILKQLDHPNIIRVYESFSDKNFYYIVMEHCSGGELFQEILKQQRFPEAKCAQIMKQIFSAVAYLHEQRVVHRDLKPENILFEDKAEGISLKLIDFGTSVQVQANKTVRGPVGSAYYIAPEVLCGPYTEKCDVWSTGVIMYILLCGHPPFHGASEDEIFCAIKKGKYNFKGAAWDAVSSQARALLGKLLVPAKARISALEALQDPWTCSFPAGPVVDSESKVRFLKRMSQFSSENKLNDAIRTLVASQFLTKTEEKEIREVFSSLDLDGDGKLSQEELLVGYSKLCGSGAEATVTRIMQEVDTDNSGFIDYTEFARVTVNRKKLATQEILRTTFEVFDRDGSGKISANELKEVLSGGCETNDQMWQQVIKEVDTNGDGEIDFEEFRTMILGSL